MNGAAFFLVVNLFIAICFAMAFAVVSTRTRYRIAALWIAAAFAIASLSALCELLVAYGDATKVWAIGAFATLLGGMILLRIGIGELYGSRINFAFAGAFFAAGVVVDLLIYDLPRGTPLQAFLYQAPFALVILSSAVAVLTSTHRLPIDRALGGLLLLTGLHFFAKAGLAVVVGAGQTAKDYIGTNYALVSQSSTAILIVAVGLMLLSVFVLGIMADERSISEQDPLSGLANRRGFDNGVSAAIARSPDGSHAFIFCDLDHFKSINDAHGHEAGDLVIRAFGDLLRLSAPVKSVVGRIGGEEFAIFLPGTSMEVAAMFAHALRSGTEEMKIAGLPNSLSVTASFGVAELVPGARTADAMRDADVALYEAKRAGRNCVREAAREVSSLAAAKPHITRVK